MVVTIVTQTFLIYARAIKAALAEFDETIGFAAVVVDAAQEHDLPEWAMRPESLARTQPRARELLQRYSAADDTDALRWSLKSQLLAGCLQAGAKKVIWSDPDLMFFEDPGWLFEQIEPDTVLLSPHFRAFRPSTDGEDFRKNYTEGLFQAGFLGVGENTHEFLDWWAEACLWDMSKDPAAGTYVDQKFLDLLPVCWDGTKILKHRGCNVADWNWFENKRTADANSVLVNGRDPVLFIHFTDGTIAAIQRGRDQVLQPYLDRYTELLRGFDPNFQLRLPEPPPPAAVSPLQRIRAGIRRIAGFPLRLIR